MSNSFVGTPARAFKQSFCRARVTHAPGFFGFQILNSIRSACDGNFAPFGWPPGTYVGGFGPFVPWIDFDYEDPRDATFVVPTASQLKQDGWLHETWLSSIQLTLPITQFFDRLLPNTDHDRLHRSHGEIFNAETIASGFKLRKGIVVVKQGMATDAAVSSYGVQFADGILYDQIQRVKIYDTIPGTATRHVINQWPTLISSFQQLPHFTATLQAPISVEEYFPASGDPPREFEPAEFAYSRRHNIQPGPGTITPGTIEILVFWFGLRADHLPSFPISINTASEFFFVGSSGSTVFP